MEDELKRLQMQLMDDIIYVESIISAIMDLVAYLDLEPRFFRELELTNSTLQELLRRTSKTIELKHIKSFTLAIKQIKMMAVDLLEKCKKNMHSA